MAAPQIISQDQIIPTKEDFEKLLTAKLSYEAKYNTPERDSWNAKHFNETPWGIAYNVSIAKHNKAVAASAKKGNVSSP
jgi:hypothetical protein